MCGALASAGAANEKWPRASLLLLAISCMPCDSESSVTSSPAEGLPVVPLVTVPVMFCAAADAVTKTSRSVATRNSVILSDEAARAAVGRGVERPLYLRNSSIPEPDLMLALRLAPQRAAFHVLPRH